MKPVFYCAANADRWKFFDDREARLAEQPKTSDTRIPISLLTPQGFIIYLPRPLNFDRNLRITLGREDIRPPWLARWTNARDFCFSVPATRSRGLNGHQLQLAMFLAFISGETEPDFLVCEEPGSALGLLENNTRFAARHAKVARLPIVGFEGLPLFGVQIESLNLRTGMIEAA